MRDKITQQQVYTVIDKLFVDAEFKDEFEIFSVAWIFHYIFLKIYPFLDGNGRMAMLLTKLILIDESIEFLQHSSHREFI